MSSTSCNHNSVTDNLSIDYFLILYSYASSDILIFIQNLFLFFTNSTITNTSRRTIFISYSTASKLHFSDEQSKFNPMHFFPLAVYRRFYKWTSLQGGADKGKTRVKFETCFVPLCNWFAAFNKEIRNLDSFINRTVTLVGIKYREEIETVSKNRGDLSWRTKHFFLTLRYVG